EQGSPRPHSYEADPGRRNYTFTPRLIEVDKSRLSFKAEEQEKDVYNPGQAITKHAGSPALNKGALWVEIIEKAYIAAGFVSESRQRVPDDELYVGNIEGGDPGIAFEHLIGQRSTPSDIKPSAASAAPNSAPVPQTPGYPAAQ